jgi:hypothetical protein
MALLVSPLLASSAWAGSAFDEDVTRFAPVPPVRGGETVRVHVQVLDADGAGRTGLGATPIGGGGRAAEWTELGDGWYAFDFTADRNVSAGSVRLRGAVSGRLPITILPQRPARLSVSGEPSSLVVGSSEPSTVTMTMPGFPGRIDLGARTSSGRIGVPTRSGDASWTTTLRAPTTNYPHLGLVTVSAPGGVAVGGGAVAFRGAVAFPIQGPPGSSLSLRIGDQTFGPVVADASGNAALPIEVPPGTRQATQIIEQGPNRTEGTLDLSPPATRRLAWIPSPGPVPVGERTTLHALVLQADGQPDMNADLAVAATAGTVGRATHIGEGLYAVDYTATGGSNGTVTASIPGSPIDVDQIPVRHLPPMPADGLPPTSGGTVSALLVLPDATKVAPGGSTTVRVVSVDRYGYPVPGAALDVYASSGTVPKAIDTGGTGVAEFAWVAGAAGATTLTVEADNGVSGVTSLVTTSAPLQLGDPPLTGMLAAWRDRLSRPTPPEPEPEPEPIVEPPVDEPPPATSLSLARAPVYRLRLGGVAGTYGYEQFPEADSGPLIPARFSIGRGVPGAKPAGTTGVELDGRAWLFDYLGGHLTARFSRYSFTSEVFSRPLGDWITHLRASLNGRVPIRLPSSGGRENLVWFGVHGGAQVDDFLVFEGCIEPGCTVEYGSILVPAIELGADVGAEVGPLHVVASIDQGWAGGSVPFRFGFDLEAGYAVTQQFTVGAGASGVVRQIAIQGADSGRQFGGIVDGQYMGRLFVGLQY